MSRSAWVAFFVVWASGCPGPSSNDDDKPTPDDAGFEDERDGGPNDGGPNDGGPDDGGPDDAGNGNPDGGPGGLSFAGIAHAVADGPSELVATWIAAVDDTTVEADLVYRVYAAGTEDAVVQAVEQGDAPTLSVTGATSGRLTGFSAGQTVVLLAVAVDDDGNVSSGRRVVTVVMPQAALVQRAPLIDLATLDLTVTELSYDRFLVVGADAASLAAGDNIVVANTFGRTLRKIVTVTPSGAGVELGTEKASLVDVFASGDLEVTGVIVDPGAAADAVIGGQSVGMRRSAYRDAATGLSIETRSRGSASLGPPQGIGGLALIDLEEDVELSYEMSFDPSVQVSAKFSESFLDTPERVKVMLVGTFAIEGLASYTLTAAREYETEVELLSRTVRFFYTVGGVPVMQTATLKLMASLEMKAESEFHASMQVNAEKTIAVGFEYDANSGFTALREDGFTQTTTFDLTGEAQATATLKIYPVVETTLYEALAARIEVVPQVNLEAEAQLLPPQPELTKCDVGFLVDAQASADLTIFGEEIAKWESDRYELYSVPLFSLPEVQVISRAIDANICHPVPVYLQVKDGVNNHVVESGIGWTSSGGTLDVLPGALKATLTAPTAGTYTIDVDLQGDGVLGVLGSRYASVDIEVTDPGVDCAEVPPPSQTGITCDGTIETGLTAPPTVRTVDDVAPGDFIYQVADFPVHLRYGTTVYRGLNLEGQLYPGMISDIGSWSEGGVYYDAGDWVISVGGPAGEPDVPPGLWVPSIYLEACNQAGGECVGYSAPFSGADPIEMTRSSAANFDISAQFFGPDFGSADDDLACYGDIGIPAPRLRAFGPRPPREDDDDPKTAPSFAQFTRRQGEITGRDRDFYRFELVPADSSVSFDQPPPPDDPACFVTVTADGPPFQGVPLQITVYRGEEGAANDTNVVVRGFDSVRFQPLPTEVYFAKIEGDGVTNIGAYVAEIDSDCTAETPFPYVAGELELSATTLTRGASVTVTVPVDPSTVEVVVQLMHTDSALGGSGPVLATLDTGLGTATATIPTYPQMNAGPFVVRVQLLNDTFEREAVYAFDASFSTETYALTRTNHAINPSPVTTSPTTVPLAIVTLE